MGLNSFAPLAAICALGLAGAAYGQTASVTAGNGQVGGTVSAGNAPPVSITAGNGTVSSSTGNGDQPVVDEWGRGHGHSVTVRSPGGAATSSVWTSGGGQSAVAGYGSPGSQITYDDQAGGSERIGPVHHSYRHHSRHHHHHHRTHRR